MLLWDHNYDVGIERIDAQHHIFLNVIAEFQDIRQQGATLEKLEGILHEVALYARYHFCSEENVMRECRFPCITEHKNMHYQLLDEMNSRMLGMREGLCTPKDVEDFLVHWFVHHTAEEDRKIGEFILAARRVAIEESPG